MKKICHITSVHNTNDGRIFVRECCSLAKKDEYEVHIVGPGEDQERSGVIISGVGVKPNSRIKRMLFFNRKVIKKAKELNADLYHIHDPELLRYVKTLSKGKAKVVFDSHENYPEQMLTKYYIPKKIRGLAKEIYLSFENSKCKLLDGAVFPCLVEGKDVFEGRVKHHCLLDNVPVSAEIPCENKTKERYVCCAGGLTKDRGVVELIEACYLADVKLVLAGAFESEELEKEIREKESFSIVDYRGIVNRNEVMKIYENATMGASTIQPIGQYAKIWNLPTKVYEFMMYGLPFVISDFEYARETINRLKCGLVVDSTDINDIARGIRQIVEDSEEASQMGKRGREAIITEFNWEKQEKVLFQFYENIFANKIQ